MNQRQITHPAGTFAACATCRKEPRHYTASGSALHEVVAFRAIPARHALECACRRATGWVATLAEAESAWGLLGATLPLPLVMRPASNVRPMRTLAKGRAQG